MTVNLLDKWRLLAAIAADQDLSPTAKIVAFRLLDHLNNGDLRCNPSYSTIARGIGKGRARAKLGAHELERRGWIKIETTSHEQAKGKPKGLPSNTVRGTPRGRAHAPNGAGPHRLSRKSDRQSLSKLALQAGGFDVDGDAQ
jgi:hypothetical protein